MSKRQILIALGLAAVIGITGCAARGPSLGMISDRMPTLQADQGRIFFYRDKSFVGAAVQPKIRLNGEEVGQSVPGGFFFADRPAGNYEVGASTEVERTVTFTLAPAETRYVRTKVGFGFFVGRVYPELVSTEDGEKALPSMSYIGAELGAK